MMKRFFDFGALQQDLKGKTNVGLVPTMGDLHAGHLQLVEVAQKTCETVVVSVFVNPTQFEKSDDFEKYPKNSESDAEKLKHFDNILLFTPSVKEVYDNKSVLEKEKILLPEIFKKWEGKTRIGHFEGVFQVLHRFFSAIQPSHVFFGQKDFQQTLLVQHLLENFFPETTLKICSIIREKHGLAMSSRNSRLSESAFFSAKILRASILETKKRWKNGEKNTEILQEFLCQQLLNNENVEKIFYANIVDSKTLEPKIHVEKNDVLLLAVQFAGVRLLDNEIF